MSKIIKRKAQVVIFCSGPQTKVLLLHNHGGGNCDPFWQNVTGSVDKGEEYQDGALRELEEETGFSKDDLSNWRELPLEYNFHDRWGKDVIEKCYMAVLTEEKEPHLDGKEHDEFKWVKLDKIDESSYNYKSNYEVFLKAKDCFED